MTGDDDPVQHCTVAEAVNLPEALAAAGIEHVGVDEQRTIVIYRRSVLMVIATAGEVTATREFDVAYVATPDDPEQDPDEILAAFVDELIASTDTVRD